ncbi:ERF family protein [Ligilactobacillus sp. LYQ139]|uniref:ERF family protein n=1 Tax=Ligilactobacillus sp. LYQ139 TaxID=3378800 RepID=UPI003853B287
MDWEKVITSAIAEGNAEVIKELLTARENEQAKETQAKVAFHQHAQTVIRAIEVASDQNAEMKKYTFGYASLARIEQSIAQAIDGQPIAYHVESCVNSDQTCAAARLILTDTESGYSETWATVRVPVENNQDPKTVQASLSYARRYALLNGFNIAVQSDDTQQDRSPMQTTAKRNVTNAQQTFIAQTKGRIQKFADAHGMNYMDTLRQLEALFRIEGEPTFADWQKFSKYVNDHQHDVKQAN